MRWLCVLVVAAVFMPNFARGETSWIFRRSNYSHDPATGERVDQFAPGQPAYALVDPTYQRSGFRYNQDSLQVGNNFDYQDTVETWGQGDRIRPYGEWKYPYRAGATPFGPWGNPQGPWTTPFGSWVNPYGLGRMPGFFGGPWGMMPNAVPGVPPRYAPGGTTPPLPNATVPNAAVPNAAVPGVQ